jgi:hypothetical protein
MSDDSLVFDAALRLLRDHTDAATFAAAERGIWPATLWKALVGAGFSDILEGGIEPGVADALQVLRAQGRTAAPVPLMEAMIVSALGYAATGDAPVLAAFPLHRDHTGTVLAYWPAAARTLAITPQGHAYAPCDQPGKPNYAGEPQCTLNAPADVTPFSSGVTFDTLWLFAALGRAAQMRGALEHILGLTVDYTNTRVQFGKPLGKQQAVQHQLALMAEQVAATGMAVDVAAQAFTRGDAGQRLRAVAAAKLCAGEAAGKAAEIAHQLHGAIGFTMEYELQRYTRRLWAWRDAFGNEAAWALELGRLLTRADAPPLWHTLTQPLENQP